NTQHEFGLSLVEDEPADGRSLQPGANQADTLLDVIAAKARMAQRGKGPAADRMEDPRSRNLLGHQVPLGTGSRRVKHAIWRSSHGWITNPAQCGGTRKPPLYPPFTRGEKDAARRAQSPPCEGGGRRGSGRPACNACELRSRSSPRLTVAHL